MMNGDPVPRQLTASIPVMSIIDREVVKHEFAAQIGDEADGGDS